MNTLTKALAFAALVAMPFVGHAQILPTQSLGHVSSAPSATLSNSISAQVTIPVATAHVTAPGLPASSGTNSGVSVHIPTATLSAHAANMPIAASNQNSGNSFGTMIAIPASSLASAQLPIAASSSTSGSGTPVVITGLSAIPASTLANNGHVAISGTSGSNTGSSGSSSSSSSSNGNVSYSSGSIPSGYGYHAPVVNAAPTAEESARYAYAQSGVTQGASSTPRTIVRVVSGNTDTALPAAADTSFNTHDSRNVVSGQASVFGLGFLPHTLVGWMAIILGLLAVMVGVREYRIIDAQKKLAAQQYASSGSYGSQMYVPQPMNA